MASDSRTFVGMSNPQENPSSLQPVVGARAQTLCPDTHSGQERRAQLPADTSLAFFFFVCVFFLPDTKLNMHLSALQS